MIIYRNAHIICILSYIGFNMHTHKPMVVRMELHALTSVRETQRRRSSTYIFPQNWPFHTWLCLCVCTNLRTSINKLRHGMCINGSCSQIECRQTVLLDNNVLLQQTIAHIFPMCIRTILEIFIWWMFHWMRRISSLIFGSPQLIYLSHHWVCSAKFNLFQNHFLKWHNIQRH